MQLNRVTQRTKQLTVLLAFFASFLLTSCVPDDNCQESASATQADHQDGPQSNALCDTPSDPPGDNGDNGDDTDNDNSDDIIDDTPTDPDKHIKESLLSPWKDQSTAIVIDAYQGNSINWDQMAGDPRVVGVIHRSSIGSKTDTKYKSRRAIARERGYLWGAYHLGYTGNVKAQVELFLNLVEDDPDTLMILDLENTTNGKFMTIAEAAQFMQMVYEKTGRIPVVYANHTTTKLLNTKMADNPLFEQSKLWYARFKSNVTDYPVGIWPNYFLWQFSSEINCSKTGSCLYNVPGTRYDMDVNVFYGSEADLRANWHND